MRSDELIAKVRLNSTLEDTHPDYTDAVILTELNDSQTTKFQRLVLDARENYWLQNTVVTTTTSLARFRLPPRAIALSKLEIGTGSPPEYRPLPPLSENHSGIFEKPIDQLGAPTWFVARGDQVELVPPADSTAYSIRVRYFIRPSKLVPQQSSTLGGGTVRGQVTAINTGTRVVTVNALPFDQLLGTPAAITSGVQSIDVVHPDGWHELALVGATQTISGLNITVGGTDALDEIQIGDFVRVADQTDWPALPDDYHRCLADVASVKILMQQRDPEKASGFAADVSADLDRFASQYGKRTQEQPRVIRPYVPALRRGMK